MAFWFMFLFWLGTSILSALLAKPPVENARPSGLDDFQVPTATEGRSLPICVGMVKMAGPNVVWFGDLGTVAIRERVGGFLGIGGNTITKAYKYHLGVQMAICSGPMGGFSRVWMGDKLIYNAGETAGNVSITDLELFGGEDSGGGIDFTLEYHNGDNDQAVSAYLDAQLTLTPRYQNVTYFILNDGASGPGYIGNSATLRNLAFEVFWFPNTLAVTGGKERIGDDANPICFLYELLTINDDWGVTMPGSDILVTGTVAEGALRVVAEQCADEGLGFSMIIDRPISAAEIIQEVERHVDGKFRLDLADGRFKIQLARPEVASVPLLDESNILKLEDYSRPSWTDTFNQVRISYADRAKDYDRTSAIDQDLANLDIVGRDRIHNMSFPGVKTAEVAAIIAAREMFTLGSPAARCKVQVKGKMYALFIGQAVELSWPDHNIVTLPMRITRIQYGRDLESAMTIDMVEDAFRLETRGLTDPPPSDHVPPNVTAVAALDERLWQINPSLSEGGLRRVATLATRDGGLHLSYEVWVDLAGGTDYVLKNTTQDWTPTVQLVGAMGGSVATIPVVVVDGGVDFNIADLDFWGSTTFDVADPSNLILVDGELMWFETATDNLDGTFDLELVHRAVVETVPVSHADNARVWFPTHGAGLVIPEELDSPPLTITAKLLPRTATGALAIASAAQLSITTVDLEGYGYNYGNNYGGP